METCNFEGFGRTIMEDSLSQCPFCGGSAHIVICDDDGNIRNLEYLDNPYSGIGYMLSHSRENNPGCPIAAYDEDDSIIGTYIYDSEEDAAKAWNSRRIT